MKFSKPIFVVGILIVFVGCSQQVSPITPSAIPDVEETLTQPSLTITTQATLTNPLPTVISQATPTQHMVPTVLQNIPTPILPAIQYACPEIVDELDRPANLGGTIVLSGKDISFQGQSYIPEAGQESLLLFWNTEKDEKTSYSLPEDEIFQYFEVSPDHQWLAFTEGKTLPMTTTLAILNSQGEENATFQLLDEWTFFDWLNIDQLVIRRDQKRVGSAGMFLLNPFTGEQQDMPVDFPDIYSTGPFWGWGAYVVYDPTMSYVVYPQFKKVGLAILWDVAAGKEIAQIPESPWVRWSPKGKQLAAVIDTDPEALRVRDEIFLVDLHGEIKQSTYLPNKYAGKISFPTWSPDGQYIAFWVSTDYFYIQSGNLAILDTLTSRVTLYCLQANPFPFRFGEDYYLGYQSTQVNGAPPIWSPDSKHLLIETNDPEDRNLKNTLLVDILDQTITKIASQARPAGWLASP